MHKNLRITFLCFGASGLVRYGLSLADAVAGIPQVTVMVLTAQQDLETARKILRPALDAGKASVVPVDGRSSFAPSILLNILRTIYRFRPHIVHDTSGEASRFVSVWPLVRVTAPLFATLHDPMPHSGVHFGTNRRLKRWWVFFLSTRLVMLSASRPTSRRRGQWLAKKFVQSRLGCGDVYRPNKASPSAALKSADRPAKQTVLFFGTLRFNKGFDLLIPIADEVARHRSDVVFLVAGGFGNVASDRATGWAARRDNILAQMKSRSDFSVRVDYVPDEEIPRLFSAATAAILPYRDATQSAVLVSAMEYGCPIVATDLPSIREVLTDGETARLAPLRPSDLADALVEVLSDREHAAERAQRAQELVRTRYSWENIAEAMLPHYLSVA